MQIFLPFGSQSVISNSVCFQWGAYSFQQNPFVTQIKISLPTSYTSYYNPTIIPVRTDNTYAPIIWVIFQDAMTSTVLDISEFKIQTSTNGNQSVTTFVKWHTVGY